MPPGKVDADDFARWPLSHSTRDSNPRAPAQRRFLPWRTALESILDARQLNGSPVYFYKAPRIRRVTRGEFFCGACLFLISQSAPGAPFDTGCLKLTDAYRHAANPDRFLDDLVEASTVPPDELSPFAAKFISEYFASDEAYWQGKPLPTTQHPYPKIGFDWTPLECGKDKLLWTFEIRCPDPVPLSGTLIALLVNWTEPAQMELLKEKAEKVAGHSVPVRIGFAETPEIDVLDSALHSRFEDEALRVYKDLYENVV